MDVFLHTIATAVPDHILVQTEARDVFASQPNLTRLAQRLVRASFDGSAIETRRSVIEDFHLGRVPEHPTFYDHRSGLLLSPSTRTRNELYIREAQPLTLAAARRAIAETEGLSTADITHVITVSCTGFYAPGPDYQLVRELGLASNTLRYNIGFMGCYASFPALRAARSFVRADPDAVVLVVSTELCSIHVRSSNDPDQIVAASVFADGSAAALISARDDIPGNSLSLDSLASDLTPVGEGDMAWTIGDEGFEMILSAAVPKIIDTYIAGAIGPVLVDEPALREDPAGRIAHWAVHPGGRSILDRVESRLGLSPEQMVPSRDTLREVGNMSSATIFFVLKRILDAEGPARSTSAAPERVMAMAFGPGLTVETGLFTKRYAEQSDAGV
ncbi:type III polyketide synthase [Klugiella xanthotipulae]|uniref:Putative naringenin-chalcone synthase n=1 Tax=Klugiella xanthotipulae TaxID=244735 RepID=A0A543I604_9MICO|nr:type III polyketide synthase [Klugiella xanthotipulae]TQM66036.1 putative naringenin-chalcone synthase [Klugiella xanthotipulae]